jgi:Zn-finger nucleic acid-binding protein
MLGGDAAEAAHAGRMAGREGSTPVTVASSSRTSVPAHRPVRAPHGWGRPRPARVRSTRRTRMKCPKDTDVTLLMTSRSGIEIDYCPECRGVWLDRGELDKLIERADRDDDDDDRDDRRDDDRWRVEGSRGRDEVRYEYDPKYAKKKKRRSFFSDLFEMD